MLETSLGLAQIIRYVSDVMDALGVAVVSPGCSMGLIGLH